MLHDPNGLQQALHSQNRPTRRPWLSLLSALIDLAQGKAELLHHAEQPWASATFAGTRHTVRLAFSGLAAIAAGEVLIEALPEHEFNLPGQLVADASITNVEHALLPEPRMEIEVALLLLEDA
ncbi:MAG: hypothetical protein O9272_10460 [Brevundimonas sp.]|jgi:hypothetical protein|nr:hypothetical protein [Brevundimonas sp.]